MHLSFRSAETQELSSNHSYRNLANLVVASRRARGMSRGSLARLINPDNATETARQIFAFERGDWFDETLLAQLVAALGIFKDRFELAYLRDWNEFFQQWKQWVDEPIPQQIVLSMEDFGYERAQICSRVPTLRTAEHYASRIARRFRNSAWLIHSRRKATQFDERGRLVQRIEALPPKLGQPFIELGGFHILGYSGFRSNEVLNEFRCFARTDRLGFIDYFIS